MSGRARLGWVLAHAVATFLAFPHPVGSSEIDLGAGMAWLSPAFLILSVWGLAPRRAAGVGLLAGLLAHSLILHWIYVVTVRYGGAPVPVGLIAPVLLAFYMAVASAVFALAWSLLERRGLLPVFGAAAAWVIVDHGRHVALTGFPWAVIGYAQHGNPALMGLAPLAGVLGISFATALGGAALAVLQRREAGLRREAVVALAVVAALHLVGWWSLRGIDPDLGDAISVAVLQGNIDQGEKWSPDRVSANVDIYKDLTREAVQEGARLVVWPETAVAAPAETIPQLREGLSALARETGAVLVVGAVGMVRPDRMDPSPPRIYDSALVFSAEGELLDRYDKTQLVPFGEYLPLRALLGSFIRAVATGSAGLDVTPGERVRRVDLPVPGWGAGSLPAGIPICYELIFPDLVRRFVSDGGGVLLGITNDAWYGRTGAPLQFLAMTAMRSAENGVWTARAANTGVSAFIDRRGRVRERSELFERGFLVSEVPVLTMDGPRTFYTRHGDWIVLFSWLLVVGITGTGILRSGARTPSVPTRTGSDGNEEAG